MFNHDVTLLEYITPISNHVSCIILKWHPHGALQYIHRRFHGGPRFFRATWRPTSASSAVHIEPEANGMMELSHEFLKKLENPNVFDLEATTHDTKVPWCLPKSWYLFIRFSQHPCDTLTTGALLLRSVQTWPPFRNNVDVTYPNNGKGNWLSQLPLDVMGPCLFLGCFRTPQYPGVDKAGTSTIMYMAFLLGNLKHF